jgi:hypothetical protein
VATVLVLAAIFIIAVSPLVVLVLDRRQAQRRLQDARRARRVVRRVDTVANQGIAEMARYAAARRRNRYFWGSDYDPIGRRNDR